MPDELILASGSPQRKRILKDLGVRFAAVPSDVEEDSGPLKNPRKIAEHLALLKARAVSARYPRRWVLGVDTLVVLKDGRIAGKPKNRAEARRILKTYQGARCDVISGIALVRGEPTEEHCLCEKSRLHFRVFSDASIDEYLNRDPRWQKSSGAMTIEGIGGRWVKKLEGDYWNVVGLPVHALKKLALAAKIRL